MHVKRFAEAKRYDAPNHHGVAGLRLQGFEEGGRKSWIGLSSFCPAVAPVRNSTPFEKVYVVLEGEMTIIVNGREAVLGRYDSCTIPAGEVREIVQSP